LIAGLYWILNTGTRKARIRGHGRER
jgi:hypothetical protein